MISIGAPRSRNANVRPLQRTETPINPMRLQDFCPTHWTLAAVAASLCGALPTPGHADATTRADQQFTSYAYAHEFGSGVYDFNGRTLQVYGLPFGWTIVEAGENQIGLRLRLPVTLGFLDFKSTDVLDTGLPEQVDSVSFVPGLEFEIPVGENWHLRPYVQAGFSSASESDVETDLFGAGVRAERVFSTHGFAGVYVGEAVYSKVAYAGATLPDDDFVRFRNGFEFTRDTRFAIRGHTIAYGLFAALDLFADPPTGPTTGIDVPGVQFETGVVFGPSPEWVVWKVPLPRVGLSYRFAGDVSAFRIVLGAPF
jgi:hypothetical protein